MITPRDVHSKTLPGDDLILHPRKQITRTIIIKATSETIWPWLVQLGSGRAGWYSYDQIDNGGKASAKRIIPEFQYIQIGDIMPALPGSKDAFIVREIHIGKALVLIVPIQTAIENADARQRMQGPLRVSWALVLETLNDDYTMLISRGRLSYDWLVSPNKTGSTKKLLFIERIYKLMSKMPWFLLLPIARTGHYFMESRMLRGIKSRAEGQAHE